VIHSAHVAVLIYGFASTPRCTTSNWGWLIRAGIAASREGWCRPFTPTASFLLPPIPAVSGSWPKSGGARRAHAGAGDPTELQQRLAVGDTAEVQGVHRGRRTPTAPGIANGYIQQILARFARSRGACRPAPPVRTQVSFSTTPALPSSWFFVPEGVGIPCSLDRPRCVSAVTLVREKDTGTLEQLLMTPALRAWEI